MAAKKPALNLAIPVVQAGYTRKRKWIDVQPGVSSISVPGLAVNVKCNGLRRAIKYKVNRSLIQIRLRDVSSTHQSALLRPQKGHNIITPPMLIEAKPRDGELPAPQDGEEVCAICHEGYKNVNDRSFLPCAHYFHKDCVDQWLGYHTSCPICMTDVSVGRF